MAPEKIPPVPVGLRGDVQQRVDGHRRAERGHILAQLAGEALELQGSGGVGSSQGLEHETHRWRRKKGALEKNWL